MLDLGYHFFPPVCTQTIRSSAGTQYMNTGIDTSINERELYQQKNVLKFCGDV